MKKRLLCFLMFLITVDLYAQNRTITGQVVEKLSGEILSGAFIREKGSSKSVVADANGNFKIGVDNKDVVLVVKYIGFKELELKVPLNQASVIFQLEEDLVQLNQVVTIGYGTVRRQDLIGAVSSVSAKDLKDVPINSAAQALAGRIAGLEVIAAEGSPDAEVKILIRGGNSITQDNTPLYIIDGIQTEDGLSGLSPQDIESIDVLKDAASTSIYGARGSNGVVIITTKGGKEGATSIVYNGFMGNGVVAKKLDVLKPYDFVVSQYERALPSGETEIDAFERRFGPVSDIESYKEKEFVDWQDATFGRKALMYTQNLRISGGNKASQFSISLSDNKQEGIVLNSGLSRKLLSLKFDHTANRKLKIGLTIRHNDQKVDATGIPTEGSSVYSMLRHAVKYTPFKIDDEPEDFIDDDYFTLTNTGNGMGILNPVALTNAIDRTNLSQATNFGGYLNYAFYKNFSFRSTIGVNYSDRTRESFDDHYSYRARVNGALPMAGISNNKQNSFNNSNVITYSNSKIAKNQSLNLLLGQELYELKASSNNIQLKEFPMGITPEKALNQLGLGTVLPQYPTSGASESRLLSFFTRANYDYGKKYLFTFALRADGSSKFSPDNRWGFFPSGAFAWRVSREKFMKNINVVSDMKFRLSYGVSGNNRIADYLYQYNFDTQGIRYALNETIIPGYAATYMANPDLKWEATTSRNIGLDVDLFKSKLQVTIDAYINTTKDLLVNAPIPSSSGYTTQLINIGNTENRGVEVQIGTNIINTKSFTWKVDFNTGFNRNTVKKLAREQNQEFYNSGFGVSNQPSDYIIKVGEPVGSMYGWISDGFYTVDDFDWNGTSYTLKPDVANSTPTLGLVRPGTMKLKDLNGDNLVDTEDKSIMGNAAPKFSGGINQQFTFKSFDLSVFLNFKYGNDIFNANKIEFTNGYTKYTNQLEVMKDRWRSYDENFQLVTDPQALAELNKDAKIWSTFTGAGAFYPISWAVEDGSFLRVNNITLGYTFSSKLLSKIKVKSLRIYSTLNNVAIWTNYSGYDPEVDTMRRTPLTPGVDYSAYPRSKTYLFGLNLTL